LGEEKKKKLTMEGQGRVYGEKKNYEPRTLSWGWVSSHPKNPKTGFFGWCTGECWVTQAVTSTSCWLQSPAGPCLGSKSLQSRLDRTIDTQLLAGDCF